MQKVFGMTFKAGMTALCRTCGSMLKFTGTSWIHRDMANSCGSPKPNMTIRRRD